MEKYQPSVKEAWGKTWVPFLLSRLLILTILTFIGTLHVDEIPGREGRNLHLYSQVSISASHAALSRILKSADANWYLEIAKTGYHPGPMTTEIAKNWAFFPLFPLLLRGLGLFTTHLVIAGVLLNNVLFFASLILLCMLLPIYGASARATEKAIWMLVFFPTSYFFSALLSESLYLLLLLSAFYLLEISATTRKGYLQALFYLSLSAICYAGLTATRPTGLLMLPAYLWRCLELRRPLLQSIENTLRIKTRVMLPAVSILLLAVTTSGALGYMYYLWNLTGNPLAFSDNQLAWGRNQVTFLTLAGEMLSLPVELCLPWNFLTLNTCSALLTAGAALYFAERRNFSLVLLLLIPLAAVLATGTVVSIGRFVLTFFPVFLYLGRLAETPTTERILLIISAVWMGLMTAGYALHITSAMA
ncbi:MAG: mannosyltransferase family protein [bacterium]|nr:mannosyltransferase family protein [bacterium]